MAMTKKMRTAAGLWLAAAVVALAGCASGVKLDEPAPVETRTPSSAAGAASGAGSSGTAQSQVASVDLSKPDSATAANTLPKVIYFDFDSFVVKDEYRGTLDAYAKTLTADRKKRLTLEGHADERGGREYNLALGQKRAEAVLRAIVLIGASEGQLEAVSYGKERPAAQGNDEAAWAKNRRVELILR